MTSVSVALLQPLRRFLTPQSQLFSTPQRWRSTAAPPLRAAKVNHEAVLLRKILESDGLFPGSLDGDLLRARILEATSSLPPIPSSDGESDSSTPEPKMSSSKKAHKKMKVELVRKDTPLQQLLQSKIARRNRTSSFYLVDLGVLADQYIAWRTQMPDVRPFYAVKCNPDLMIVRSLLAMGCGLDCASKTEMRLALGAGCAPENIIFANPCKSPEALVYAQKHGINTMTFDNEIELGKIRKFFGTSARPVLRILGDDSFSQMAFGSKFGATPVESLHLLQVAADLGFDVEGISFHVGSGCHSPKAYLNTFDRVAQIREKGLALGHSMRLVDIGGGWPGADSSSSGISFSALTEGLNARLLELFPRDEVELISEPGRFFASSTTTLTTCVISRRDRAAQPDVAIVDRHSPVDETKPRSDDKVTDDRHVSYYVSDGIYGSFNNVFFDHALPSPRVFETPGERVSAHAPSVERFSSTLYGPTCDSIDVLMKDVVLPSLQVGDWIYFKEMGAYTCASSSTFNGFLKPNSFYIMNH